MISGIVYSKDPIFSPSAYKRSVFGLAQMTYEVKGRELSFTSHDKSILDICENSSNISFFVK